MKNIFILFVLSVFLISCNESEKLQQIEEKSELTELEGQLKMYNDNFFNENTMLISTRKGGWKWIVEFVLADCGGGEYGGKFGSRWGGNSRRGGVIGAILGGIVGSAFYAIVSGNVSAPLDNSYIYNNDNKINYVGEIHNAVLSEILKNKNKYLNSDNTVKEDILYLDIERKVKQYDIEGISDVDYAIIRNNRSNLFSFCNEMQLIQLISNDSEDLVNRVYEKLTYYFPEEQKSLNINRTYILNAANISDQELLKTYANGYEKIIIDSKMSPEFKINTLAPITLTKNSQAYWMKAIEN